MPGSNGGIHFQKIGFEHLLNRSGGIFTHRIEGQESRSSREKSDSMDGVKYYFFKNIEKISNRIGLT